MRKIILMLILFISGCTLSNEALHEHVEEEIASSMSIAIPHVKNVKTPYYRYYLPPHIGIRDENKIGAIFVSHQEEFFMNIDIPTIIMRRYYKQELENNMRSVSLSRFDYQYKGQFERNDELLDYEILINKEVDDSFILLVHSNYVVLSSNVPLAKVPVILADMILLMRSIEVEDSQIIQAYSRKEIINYQQQVIEMFEQVAPESGTLIDMDNLIKGEFEFPDYDELIDIDLQDDDETEEGE